jgi:hypothetical protein
LSAISVTEYQQAVAGRFSAAFSLLRTVFCWSLSWSKRALHNCDDPFWTLSLSKERARERFRGRFARPVRSGCGRAQFRLTSPAARDARGGLSLDKERLRKAPRVDLPKVLLDK